MPLCRSQAEHRPAPYSQDEAARIARRIALDTALGVEATFTQAELEDDYRERMMDRPS